MMMMINRSVILLIVLLFGVICCSDITLFSPIVTSPSVSSTGGAITVTFNWQVTLQEEKVKEEEEEENKEDKEKDDSKNTSFWIVCLNSRKQQVLGRSVELSESCEELVKKENRGRGATYSCSTDLRLTDTPSSYTSYTAWVSDASNDEKSNKQRFAIFNEVPEEEVPAEPFTTAVRNRWRARPTRPTTRAPTVRPTTTAAPSRVTLPPAPSTSRPTTTAAPSRVTTSAPYTPRPVTTSSPSTRAPVTSRPTTVTSPPSSGGNNPGYPLLPVGTTWNNRAWCGSGGNCQSDSASDVGKTMIDVDLFDSSATSIASLRKAGHVVICYISGGSYEKWRPDASLFPSSIMGVKMDGWDETWLDIRKLDLIIPVMSERIKLAKSKGCHGIEVDNVDCWQNKCVADKSAGDQSMYQSQLAYNRWMANYAHSIGLSIGLKNNLDQVKDLADIFDFAVNEQCQQYKECGLLSPFTQRNKAVFGTEYQGSSSTVCNSARSASMSTLIDVGGKWSACPSLAPASYPFIWSDGSVGPM